MTNNFKKTAFQFALILLLIFHLSISVKAQEKFNSDTVKAGLYDMGKMWTFDYPPVEYLKTTYGFAPDEKWFEETRLSALRFANYCSASFVSSNGLVMTNHHCARQSGVECQKPGENFLKDGFYAKKYTDERKVQGLYVDQLVKIEDITARVKDALDSDTSATGKIAARDAIYKKLIASYSKLDEWKGLELQTVQFYNGGKYSLYGFKRYNDIRLVFMPELFLGFFGGDFDNFTYPRYDLDCSFFRVYDEHGQPLKTTHYFKFNQTGAAENEPVFIVGNPGSTRRLSTVSDLEFNRDIVIPIMLKYYRNRSLALQEYNKDVKNDSIFNTIFGLENSFKAKKGELDGLLDPYIFARKAAFEKKFKKDALAHTSTANQLFLWDNINKANAEAAELYKTQFFFSPSNRLTGDIMAFADFIEGYLIRKQANTPDADFYLKRIASLKPGKFMGIEERVLAVYLQELLTNFGSKDIFVEKALNGKTPAEAAKWLLATTKLTDPKIRTSLASNDTLFIQNFSDPLLDLAKISAERYLAVFAKYNATQANLFANKSSLGRLLFDLYGTTIPPDATFSLRINDGVVKGYDYNGTKAPSKTTFYGLYDRYFSFNKQYPWNLPEKWQNPPTALLPITMDFVTTNDIIGGNSGSPMINKNREIVGLVFDGNMESLPGGFIYIPDQNRSVGVQSTGMLGALKYIYKATRLENELLGK